MVHGAARRHRPAEGCQGGDEALSDPAELLRALLAAVAVVVVVSVSVGVTAPRWPDRWLARDAGPLRLTRWDTRQRYERLGVLWLKRRFPEGGRWAGGRSKSRLPDLTDRRAIGGYIRETRRAEWVHWVALLSWVPALFFPPAVDADLRLAWWLAVALVVLTAAVNMIPIGIVRYNRLRLYRVLADLPE